MAQPCRPQRTWHARQKTISLIAVLILMVAFFAMTIPRFNSLVFKPGDLATPHAQILAGTWTSSRCVSCHAQAGTNLQGWFSASQSGHEGLSQTDRCLNCHHTTIDEETAKLAHNLPHRIRADLRLASVGSDDRSWHDLLPGPSVDQENLQCSACHREHRGADSDLLAVSDSQCQTCHADRFGSFATSHPDWDRWPYGRGGEISFNHASHANKHFPATASGSGGRQFQCVDCHRRTADHELTRSTSYDQACKSCHDKALRIQSAQGVELFALPTLPTESADKIETWPESATGFFDGELTPIANLLMRSDRKTASAIRRLPIRDFGRIDPRSWDDVAAAETVARAHRRLLGQIAEGGQQVIVDRMAAVGVAPSTLSSFVQSLSPQLVIEANRRWFNTVPDQTNDSAAVGKEKGRVRQAQFEDLSVPPPSILRAIPGEGGLLGRDDPVRADPLYADPLEVKTDQETDLPTRFDADQMMPSGGWFRDDLRLAIRYRGGGHDDPVLKAAIEMISQLSLEDRACQQLLQTPAVSACVACHPGAISSPAVWGSNPLIGRKSEFTKFTHSPHLNVAQLADCRHCHTVGSAAGSEGEMNLTSGIMDVLDFAPLGREACAACHTPHAAGEACTKCHRYHIDLR